MDRLLVSIIANNVELVAAAEKIFFSNRSVLLNSGGKLILPVYSTMPDFSVDGRDVSYPCCNYVSAFISSLSQEQAVAYFKEVRREIITIKRNIRTVLRNGGYDYALNKASNTIDLDRMTAWLDDNSRMDLYSFALFDYCRVSTQVRYISLNLSYLLLHEMGRKYISSDDSFKKLPDIYAKSSLFSLVPGRKAPDAILSADGQTVEYGFSHMGKLPDGRMASLRVTIGELPANITEETEEEYKSILSSRCLNDFDYSLYVAITNQLYPQVMETRFLSIRIKNLYQLIYPQGEELTLNLERYFIEKTELSLKKWRKYDISYQIMSDSGKYENVFGVYNNFVVSYEIGERDSEGFVLLKLYFSDPFLNKWFRDSSEKIFLSSTAWDALSYEARLFAFYFQEKRVSALLSGRSEMDLSLYDVMVAFPGKRKKAFLEEFESVMSEYEKNFLFFSQYDTNGTDGFHYLLIPLSDEEKIQYKIEK